MPNHCQNALLVEGPKVELNRFFNSCIREESSGSSERKLPEFYIDFNRLVPLAEDATNHDRSFHWSTKWNSYDCNQLFLPPHIQNKVLFTFNTAWAPPLGVFLKGSRLYPNLSFSLMYFETGNGLAGIYKFKNNNIIYENDDSPEMQQLCNDVMRPEYDPYMINLLSGADETNHDRLRDKIMPGLLKMPGDIKNTILLMLFVDNGGTDNYASTIPPLISTMMNEVESH